MSVETPSKREKSIVVWFDPEVEAKLRARAASVGLPVEEYVGGLIQRDLSDERSLDVILEPFRRAVQASGITDEEYDELFQVARDEWHQAKGAR